MKNHGKTILKNLGLGFVGLKMAQGVRMFPTHNKAQGGDDRGSEEQVFHVCGGINDNSEEFAFGTTSTIGPL